MLRSYSVIVPVLDERAVIQRTLQSIGASMSFFDAHHARARDVRGEVIVVDEGSTDGTLELVREHARGTPRVQVVEHGRSLGAGPARNTGARLSRGDVLFFCDADDLYYPEHVFVGFSVLDHSARAAGGQAESLAVRVGDRTLLEMSATKPIAALRSSVHLADKILPYWKAVIENTLVHNLCVRRECHDWGEGFPEEAVYRQIGGSEDVAYSDWLGTFFRVGQIGLETVEHFRYPGNSFDRQLQRFLHPPGSGFEGADVFQQSLRDIRLRREEEKIGYLLDRWLVLGPPPLPAAFLNWDGVLAELVRRQRSRDAKGVLEQAIQRGVSIAPRLRAQIEE